MSWFNRRIMAKYEVTRKSPTELPCKHQIGSQVGLIIVDHEERGAILSGYVVGITFYLENINYLVALDMHNGMYMTVEVWGGDLSHSVENIPDSEFATTPEQILEWVGVMEEREKKRYMLPIEPALKLAAKDGELVE